MEGIKDDLYLALCLCDVLKRLSSLDGRDTLFVKEGSFTVYDLYRMYTVQAALDINPLHAWYEWYRKDNKMILTLFRTGHSQFVAV